MGDRELERESKVSSARTEGSPRRNILVRAMSEPNDMTAQEIIREELALGPAGLILSPTFDGGT